MDLGSDCELSSLKVLMLKRGNVNCWVWSKTLKVINRFLGRLPNPQKLILVRSSRGEKMEKRQESDSDFCVCRDTVETKHKEKGTYCISLHIDFLFSIKIFEYKSLRKQLFSTVVTWDFTQQDMHVSLCYADFLLEKEHLLRKAAEKPGISSWSCHGLCYVGFLHHTLREI